MRACIYSGTPLSFANHKLGVTMSNWLSDSIMANKVEANGKQNSSHSITEDSQGKYHYVLGA
mgnify:CR=1 FL=1